MFESSHYSQSQSNVAYHPPQLVSWVDEGNPTYRSSAIALGLVGKLGTLKGSQLAPQFVEGLPLAGAKDVVNARIKGVALALPRGAQPPRWSWASKIWLG